MTRVRRERVVNEALRRLLAVDVVESSACKLHSGPTPRYRVTIVEFFSFGSVELFFKRSGRVFFGRAEN